MATGGRAFNKTMDAGGAVLGGAKRKVGAFLGAKIPGTNAYSRKGSFGGRLRWNSWNSALRNARQPKGD